MRGLLLGVAVLALSCVPTAIAAAASPAWVVQFGSVDDDGGRWAAPAPGGGAYIVSSWGIDCCSTDGKTLLRRYAPNGNFQWSKELPEDGYHTVSAVAADASGVYIATDVNPTVGHLTRSIVLRKYSHAGDLLYTKPLGLDGTDRHPVMASDGSKVYVAWLRGTTDLGVFRDIWFGRLEEDGAVTGLAHAQSDSENLYLGADATSLYIAVMVFHETVVPNEPALGGTDLFIRRFDVSNLAHTVWYHRIGTHGSDVPVAMLVNAKGVYPAWIDDRGADGGDELAVQRFSKAGAAGWVRKVPIRGNGAATVDASGVYLVGELEKAFPGFHRKGVSDAFARKIGNGDKVAWSTQWGTPKVDGAWAATASAGNLYVTGYTYGKFPGQVDHTAYDYDVFLARLSTRGH